ncbi:hypothetical protein Pfo_001921 [Paulownia fortunei]|nr:hypothetical protein Pfo_001921 [Paulownia fortunei]
MAEKDENQNSAKLETNKFDNPNDPLYLHYSDQPGLVLITQPLNGENYNTWSHAMLMALNIKNKEGFVNGTVKQPPETSITKLQQWRRCNNLVKAWLFNSISQDIGASIIYNESAHEIWFDLKDRFSHTNNVHLFHVEEAIHYCKQDNMTIAAYYTKLKGLWDERDALCSIPKCTYGTMKFLMGLNELYSNVRGQILLMDPLPTIFTPKNLHLKCKSCDKIGHTSETCRAHLKCDYCGWQGYTIDVCRRLQKMNATANRPDHREHKKVNHVDANAPFTLTAEQYQNLMTLLSGNKPTIGKDDWDGN